MKIASRISVSIALFMLAALCAVGQTTTTTPATTSTATGTTPSSAIFVSIGGEYNHYSAPSLAAATVELGVCGSKICSITTIEMQRTVSTVRTGFGYLVKKTGRLRFFGTMDAGATFGLVQATAAAAGSTVALGNLGGGFRVRVDLGGLRPLGHAIPAGFGFVAGMRMAAVTATSVQPEFLGAVSYHF